MDALISAENAKELVQQLAVPDLYFLIREVGLGDSIELLELCSNEQVQGCLDLEIWTRDRPQIQAFLPWLAALRETGFEHFGIVWAGLDPELTSLVLARLTRIYDKSLGEEVPPEEERDYFETPDTFFQVVLTTDDENENKLVHAIIEDLYRSDMVQAQHSLMAARSEPLAELEEMSYRWRSGRMADLGYVDFYDALEVFRPIDLDSVCIGEGTKEGFVGQESREQTPISSGLPVPMLEPLMGRTFLARTLEQVEDPDDVERLQQAVVFVANRVLSAARLPAGDREAVELATTHALATVALGLEYISDGEQERAVAAVKSISLSRLHRVGYTLTLRLARLARALLPQGLTAGEPTASVLLALLAKRPFFPAVLREPSSSDLLAFESKQDLALVAEHLRRLGLRIAVATSLGVDLVALAAKDEPRPELDDYIRTALVRATLGETLTASPLSPDDLRRFRAGVCPNGAVEKQAQEEALQAVTALIKEHGVVTALDALPSLVNAWLGELSGNLGNLRPEDANEPAAHVGLIVTASME